MNYRFKILTFVLLFCSALLTATEPVVIGQSNSKSATAFNNGRRIARNLNDRRIVVFQDSTALKHTIMWTWSDDGDNWSTPQILGEGKNPSITIDSGGTFYTVWDTAQ